MCHISLLYTYDLEPGNTTPVTPLSPLSYLCFFQMKVEREWLVSRGKEKGGGEALGEIHIHCQKFCRVFPTVRCGAKTQWRWGNIPLPATGSLSRLIYYGVLNFFVDIFNPLC
jgi:hypothetical protein